MTTSNIVKHDFSYEIICEVKKYNWEYQKQPNFWCKSHPLSSIGEELQKMIPFQGEAEEPMINALRLSNNMYYDMYNNGGGNGCRWAITKEFKRSIRKAKLNREIIKSLEERLSNIFQYVCRGRNFGFPKQGCEHDVMYALEIFATDVTYYAALQNIPEELAKIELPQKVSK